ncbi:hypothetical protein [Thermus tenuipuniceus]|uniref:hypothetical protein n=1 Tax=Thermus tenuipuniceus TaxID=2078690 RepID=UPI001FC9117B
MTVIPLWGRVLLELLERLGAEGLAGRVVVDAGFLYPEVARGVRAKGGEYLLVLKGNQGELLGWVLAVLRAHLVSWLNREGVRRKKVALEAFSFNPVAALRFLGLYAV